MKVERNARGFPFLSHPEYTNGKLETRIVAQSSAIGDYEDSFDKPGSSYLWLGDNHHLNREEVAELVNHLSNWLQTGDL